MIVAIDPGTSSSGVVFTDKKAKIIKHGFFENNETCQLLRKERYDHCIIEKVVNYGNVIGTHVFDTVFWSGRFSECALNQCDVIRVSFPEIRMHHCGNFRAKEIHVKQILKEKYRDQLFLKKTCILKAKDHTFSAYALATYFIEKNNTPKPTLINWKLSTIDILKKYETD